MIKNELDWALKTLQSAAHLAQTVVILDTGSTDGTLEQIQAWTDAEGNEVRVHVKEAKFIDFATSRNMLLDFCAQIVSEPYLLLLDAGDLVEGTIDGLVGDGALIHGRARIIKTHSGWRFKGAAYEYLVCGSELEPLSTLTIRRDPARKKSTERLQQDYALLKQELQTHPDDFRATFHLARTCELLGAHEEAAAFYQIRLRMTNPTGEDMFWTLLGLGRCYRQMNLLYLAQDAFLCAYDNWMRAEPLVELARIAIRRELLHVAFLYLKRACELGEGEEENVCYQYYRWHYMGMIAYHVQEYDIGIDACNRALAYKDTNLDRENLSFYLNANAAFSE